ncbi:MAG: T9SS type A sorting domain-containing protein [Candidatus Edwardsbacteria bacterium]|nr:T9SS type A sorting domain-containing protein [Candidatus Edwardsbacteria bacterium]
MAWVQDTGTIGGGGGRGVYQCAKVELSALSGVASGPGAAPVMILPSLAVSPNPCAGRAVISYALPRAGRARVRLYNTAGQLMATLQDGQLPAGRHRCHWQAAGGAPSGTYFIRAECGGHTATARVTVVR